MPDEQHTLAATATLTAGVSSGATTLPLSAAIGVADGRTMRVVCEGEVLLVTAGMGTTSLTVTRGQEGTTAAAHPSGATVQQRLTPAGLVNTRTQPNPHAHNGTDGSGTVAHSATTGRTANDHHAQAHSLTGTDHTLAGLTTGHVLTATSPTAAAFQAPSGGGGAPSAHAASHSSAGSDPVTVGNLAGNLTQARSHDTPDTDTGTSSLHHTLGTGANQAAAGNDGRLSDARTPTAHASSHVGGGSDAIAAFVASGAGHKSGLVPDPGGTGGTTKYLREDSSWQVPPGGGGGFANPMTAGGDLIVGDLGGALVYLAAPGSSFSGTEGGDGSLYEFGEEFSCSSAQLVNQIGWYRPTVGAPTPTALRLWDTTATGSPVINVTSGITDDGVVGWQWTDVTSFAYVLVATRHYRVSYAHPAGTYLISSTFPTPSSGVTDHGARYTSPSGGYPASTHTVYFGVSIALGSGGGGAAGDPIRKPVGVDGAVLTAASVQTGGMTWTPPFQTLTDGATVTWDVTTGHTAQVTLGGNRTLAAPTNLIAGQQYTLHVVQDGTGSRTLTWPSIAKWPGGTAPTLSTGAGKRDVFMFSTDGTNLYAVVQALDVR